MNLYQSKLPAF